MEKWTYVKSHAARCMTDGFIAMVQEKYHFAPEDGEGLFRVGKRLAAGIKGREGFYIRLSGAAADVILTLGPMPDALQEAYDRQFMYLESYMIEMLCSELLRECYRELEVWLLKQTGSYIRQYHFYGSGKHPGRELQSIPAILKASGQQAVACTGGFCLKPKKSVIFAAELTDHQKESCPNICQCCEKKACQNRQDIAFF